MTRLRVGRRSGNGVVRDWRSAGDEGCELTSCAVLSFSTFNERWVDPETRVPLGLAQRAGLDH